jgi:hypothetical protein
LRQERFEDAKGVIRSRILKDRQYNSQMKKRKTDNTIAKMKKRKTDNTKPNEKEKDTIQ